MTREFALERNSINERTRTVELSFSSELPVERYFGNEVLDHSPGACDLSRLNSGGALLVNHDTDDQIGVCEKAWIDEADKKGRAVVKFSKSARAKEIFDDVADGIRSLVSVSYQINKVVRESETDGVETYRVQSWQPLEISFVSVPADPSVGVGRTLTPTPTPTPTLTLTRIMPEPIIAPAPAPAPAPATQTVDLLATRNAARDEERARVREIRALGKLHNCSAVAETHCETGNSLEEFRNYVLTQHYQAKPVAVADPAIGMSAKEVKAYSICRALNLLANGRPLDGLEREASDAVAKNIRREPSGFFVPHDVQIRGFAESKQISERALTAGTASAGGFTIGTNLLGGSMIELLRNNMVVASLGTTNLSGLVGNIAIPKHTGGATAYWLAETATVTGSAQTFGQLGLVPRRLCANTAYSKQLLMQSSIDVEGFVRMDLMEVLGLAKDLAAISGAGGAEPLGILNTTGVGTITYSAAPTWAKVVENETTLATANARRGNVSFLTTPAVVGKWKTVPKVTAQPIYLIEGGQANGYPVIGTTQMTSANLTIFGNWKDYILADWDGIDVVVDPYTLATQNQIQVVITIHTDQAVRQVGSFVVSTDSGAQ